MFIALLVLWRRWRCGDGAVIGILVALGAVYHLGGMERCSFVLVFWVMLDFPAGSCACIGCGGAGCRRGLNGRVAYTIFVRSAWSSEVKLRMGDLGGLTSQLTLSSFRTDVKLGVPCLDAACTVGLN